MAAQAGYELGKVSQISVSDVADNQVLRQFPPPGAEEILSPRIDVLVSRGSSANFVMPDVLGHDLNRVLMVFKRNGFKVGEIQYQSHPTFERGTVIKQFPEPGHILALEVPINLEVAR